MINFLKLPLGIAICLLVVHIEGIHGNTFNPCTGTGFFALVDNTSEFYACDETPTGGYSVRYLQCQTGLVFSAHLGKCVEQLPLPAEEIISPEARDDGNIENPTIPPTNLDESTSTVQSTEESTTKATESSTTTEDKESSSTSAVTDDGENTSSTKDDESSSTSAVTEDGESSSTAAGESSTSAVTQDGESTSTTSAVTEDGESTSTSAVTQDGESTSTSAVTQDGESTSTSAEESSTSAVTQDGESSSTTAVTKDDDSSSSSSVVTESPNSSTTEQSDDNICATNGFLPKSGNCSQYVYCQDKGDYLKPYNFDCPQDMQFNPTCNYCIKGYDCTKA